MPNGADAVRRGRPDGAGRAACSCKWDPHITPIIAEEAGTVRFEDISRKARRSARRRDEATGTERCVIMEHKGDLHPQIIIEDDRGQILKPLLHPGEGLPGGARGQKVTAGHAAGQDAARGVAAPRTSPAVCRA